MIKAVIFDMDGVIVNDEDLHQQAWRIFCKNNHFQLSDNDFKNKVNGRPEKETFESLFKVTLSDNQVQQYSNQRIDIVISLIPKTFSLNAGFKELLNLLKKQQIAMAVATSSRRRFTDYIMNRFNLREYFKAIVTAQDINKGKPDPEIYLKTASILNVKPAECLVFEDSVSGVKSGKVAGMKVIGITTTHSAKDLMLADEVISSFDNFILSDI
jgi:beta-phosphoglucomutase family hydrolase